LRVPALGYSAAELRHGSRASISPATSVLVLRQNDQAAVAVDDLVRDLDDAGETVFTAGGAAGTLPWIGRSSRPIAPSRRWHAGEASIPTIRPT